MSRFALAFIAVALAAGCKDKSQPKQQPTGESGSAAGTPAPAAAPLAPAEAEGRCANETPDRTFDALYFYPSRNELFVPTSKGSAFRLPILLRESKSGAVEFTYKWAADETAAATTHPGAVTRRPDGKLKFQLETIKDSTCALAAFATFSEPLSKLGVAAGTYRDDANNDELILVDGEQKLLSNDKGKQTPAFYRVMAHDPGGAVTLIVSQTPPASDRPTIWVPWTVTAVGDTITVDYMGQFKRTYRKRP